MWNSQLVQHKLVICHESQNIYLIANDPQTLRSLDYSTLAAVSVLDKLKDKCHFAKRSMATLKSMATLTMQMKLSTAEFATPPSCFTHPSVSKETLPSLPTNTRMPDLRQFQGQISHDADPAGNASLQDSFQFPRSEFPPIPCEDEISKFKLAEDSLSKIPTITRDPEDNIKYKSMDFKPSEEACVFQGAISTPESLQSWNNSNVEASKYLSNAWCHTSEPLTPRNFTHSSTEDADIQASEDFLDAYIVGWT